MQPFQRLILQIIPKYSTISRVHTNSSQPQNPIIYNYLIDNFNVPKPKALSYSNRFSKIQNLEKPESVVKYFKSLGFTNTQIISSVNLLPRILFSDVDTTLKPKIDLFQELGFSGSNLGKYISWNSPVFSYSLNKRLKPTIEIIRNILCKGNVRDVNDDLRRVLERRSWIFNKDHRLLLSNVSYLESCGVKGSQLAKLLIYHPKLISGSESYLKGQVSKALDLGFTFDSRMFVHGLVAISDVSNETFLKKLKLFKSFGLTDIESMTMVKCCPGIVRVSEDKLRLGFGFYLETVGLEKSALIKNAVCLELDMRKRIVPRYRVVNLIKSKRIQKKEIRLTTCFKMSEEKFLQKYITRFPDHAEDLWDAYKGNLVHSID